jgi:hypothetical protein
MFGGLAGRLAGDKDMRPVTIAAAGRDSGGDIAL